MTELVGLGIFIAKLAMVLLAKPFVQKLIEGVVEFWAEKKQCQTMLESAEYGKRIAELEKVLTEHSRTIGDHSARMEQNELSNKALGDKIDSLKTQLQQSAADILIIGSDLKKNIDAVSTNLSPKLGAVESTVKVHDNAIRELFGKVTIKK